MIKDKNILIVDDIPLMRLMLKKYLNNIGDHIVDKEENAIKIALFEAANGEEAYNILVEQEIDLVFLDIMMPGVDGISFLELKKQNKEKENVPVIVTSAVNEPAVIAKTKELGVKAYINKPFTLKTIEKEVQKIFA